MAKNQRQTVLERHFLSKGQKSTTFSGTTSAAVSDIARPPPTSVPTTSRVYWSPTRGHRLEQPKEKDDTKIETTSVDISDKVDETSNVKLPQIPTLEAYRLVNQQLINVWRSQPKQEEKLLLKELLEVASVPHLPLIRVSELDTEGVVSIPGVPDSCQPYRHRRDSIDRTANENWLLMQDISDSKVRHKKSWSKLHISSDTQSMNLALTVITLSFLNIFDKNN